MCKIKNFDAHLMSNFLQKYLFSLSKKKKEKNQLARMSTMTRKKVSDNFMWIKRFKLDQA